MNCIGGHAQAMASVAQMPFIYLASIRPEMQRILSQFQISDAAIKVVGMGSVGTRCSIGVFASHHPEDAPVLKVKKLIPLYCHLISRQNPRPIRVSVSYRDSVCCSPIAMRLLAGGRRWRATISTGVIFAIGRDRWTSPGSMRTACATTVVSATGHWPKGMRARVIASPSAPTSVSPGCQMCVRPSADHQIDFEELIENQKN